VSMRRICSITTDEPYRFSRGLLKWLNIRDHPHLRHIVFLGPALIIPAASLRALIQSSLRRGIRQFKLNPSHLAHAHILRTCPVSPAAILDMVRNRRVTLKFACKFSYRIHSPVARSTALARGVCMTLDHLQCVRLTNLLGDHLGRDGHHCNGSEAGLGVLVA
jgi:hypothetical protein